MKKEAFRTHLSVEVETLEIWLAREWLLPAMSETDLHFSDADVARGRLIQELRGGFGVNEEGVDIILHLLDQLHGVRQAFEGLRADAAPKIK